ncbi:MAG TPA: HEAT repeat domain-containing protein [Kofleriaceae bacterium]
MRAVVLAAVCLALAASSVLADTIDTNIRALDGGSYKVRLSAALSLAKSRDKKAVIALARALRGDGDATIRRVSALALEKMVDARTDATAKEIAIAALELASTNDRDSKVRDTAEKVLKGLAGLRRTPGVAKRTSTKPEVFVNIDSTTDQSKQLPSGAGDRLMRIVRQKVESANFKTSWPGGLPTAAELTSNRSRAFIIASTVTKIEITKVTGGTQVACTVTVRIAPWSGRDGGEKWEANRAASASGTARAMTGNRDSQIQGGVRDCLDAVAEDVAARRVLPFLKQVASAGS